MRPNVLTQGLPSLVALVAIGASGCADERKGPATGALDGKCYANGTCNPGLECQEQGEKNVCVQAPNAGAVGGLCYENGSCNPGLICVADRCEADTTIPVGTIGGACYANGTCNPDLFCDNNVCSVDNRPRQGLVGGACYNNGTCNPGLICAGGTCEEDDTIPSGTIGGACLQNGTCDAGLLCVATTCEVDDRLEVGTSGAQCFPNGTCNAGLLCVVTVDAGESSAECAVDDRAIGEIDEPCFANSTCKAGLACDRVTDTCVNPAVAFPNADGTDGGLCFANGTCDAGLVCNSMGLCQPIVPGGLDGPCLPFGECNLGLACYTNGAGANTCQPRVDSLASLHGIVTDYIDNARLANVEVTMIHLGAAQTSVTDELGYYTFDDLMPGEFELTFVSLDGTHTTRRFGNANHNTENGGNTVYEDYYVASCNIYGDPDRQDDERYDGDQEGDPVNQFQNCNTARDMALFPFTATESGTVWYLFDQEVVPAAGVEVVADYDHWNPSNRSELVDISPDRFTTTTDANGRYTFTNLPNTGYLGVDVTVMPSSFNGIDFQSYHYEAMLDVFVGNNDGGDPNLGDNIEVFLNVAENAPFFVSNSWEDFVNGDFPVGDAITATFSRTMKIEGCRFYIDDDNVTTNVSSVSGDMVWSNDNRTVTFTPHNPLKTDTKYYVAVVGCESFADDQLFSWLGTGEGNDNNNNSFTTQPGIKVVSTNADHNLVNNDPTEAAPEASLAGKFGAADNIEITFSLPPDLLIAGTGFELYRIIAEYPGNTNPDDADTGTGANTTTEIFVASTTTADGRVVSIDPDNDLVANGWYRVYFTASAGIAGNSVTDQFDFRVQPIGSLEFMFADIPVVTSVTACTLPAAGPSCPVLTDPAANITLTFSKDVAATSFVTIEEDDHDQTVGDNGFILDSTATIDGSTIMLDPAADLEAGKWYTIRYHAAAADGEGTSVGTFSFKVVVDVTIAFEDDNLGLRTNVSWNAGWDIFLDFTAAVGSGVTEDSRTLVELIGPDGQLVTGVSLRTDDASEAGVVTQEDGRLIVDIDHNLAPNTEYLLRVKAYASAATSNPDSGHSVYVQFEITFTTENHITLVGANIGTYEDSDGDGFFEPGLDVTGLAGNYDDGVASEADEVNGNDDQAAAGPFVLTFTVAPDFGPFYENSNFARLYRDDGVAGCNAGTAQFNPDTVTDGDTFDGDNLDDFVAATTTVAGAVVTVTPVQALQAGRCYWLYYNVSSAIELATDNDGSTTGDVSETAQLFFKVTGDAAVDPVAPVAAPTGFVAGHIQVSADPFGPVLASLVDGDSGGTVDCANVVVGDTIADDCRLDIQWTRVTDTSGSGEQWYEVYGADGASTVEDALLIDTYRDDVEDSVDNDQNAARQTETLVACGGGTNASPSPFGAVYCDADHLAEFFSDGNTLMLWVRACNPDGCGPFAALPLALKDNTGPQVLAVVQWDVLDGNGSVFRVGGLSTGAVCAAGEANCLIHDGSASGDPNDPTGGPRGADNDNAANSGARLGFLVFYDEASNGTSSVSISGANPQFGALTNCTTLWNAAEVDVNNGAAGVETWDVNEIAFVQCDLDPPTNPVGTVTTLGTQQDDVVLAGVVGASGAAGVSYDTFNLGAACSCETEGDAFVSCLADGELTCL